MPENCSLVFWEVKQKWGINGYNTIKTTEKLNASISNSSKFEDHKLQNTIGNQLVSNGFYEMLANSLTTDKYVALSELE